MDRILNFVALRRPSQTTPAFVRLGTLSGFQNRLAEAAKTPTPLNSVVAVARSFISDGPMVEADAVKNGKFIALFEQLSKQPPDQLSKIQTDVREAVGDLRPFQWADDAIQARDSVLAAYLLGDRSTSAATASKLVRVYCVMDAVFGGNLSQTQLDLLLHAPLVLPDYLLGLRDNTVTDAVPPTPDVAAAALMEQFQSAQQLHSRLGDTLAQIASHDEDELVLSELGEQRPLASLYKSVQKEEDPNTDTDSTKQRMVLMIDELTSSSPLRRAASGMNVMFSDKAVRLLSKSARETLQSLGLDPLVATVQEMQSQLQAAHDQATQNLQTLSERMAPQFSVSAIAFNDNPIARELRHSWTRQLGMWKFEPVDEPVLPEPVATMPPASFTTIKPLGLADLFLVRTHIGRYEPGEIASLENILRGEKLTHTVRSFSEVETTDTTESEQSSLLALTQAVAEQNAGKTIAQVGGAGRGPLISDGPESFSKAVTDQVSSTSLNRNRKVSVARRLQRNEELMEHVIESPLGADVRFGVYQWLDKVYEAQVFRYGDPRLLYDIIIPEPAALFREALSRTRGQAVIPPRPAKFTVPVTQLNPFNWSYYVTGHQATGVDAPPSPQVIVTVPPFVSKAPDPFGSELNANTLVISESRIAKIPKGYKATKYRLMFESIGYSTHRCSAFVGSKTIGLNNIIGMRMIEGSLENEVDSLPVGLVASGDRRNIGVNALAVAVEIICVPSDEAMSAWQTKAHSEILSANKRRLADYEERVANRDATARLQLQSLSTERKAAIIQIELKRTALAVLTNQNFSTFNANRVDEFGFPYPVASATLALSPYIRFFEQAVEWEHIQCAFFPYYWGSRSSWVSKILNVEKDPLFSAFLGSGAARVVLPIRPGYEAAFEYFQNTGKTPSTDELLDVGSPLWVSLVSQLRHQGAEDDPEVPVGTPWEFRLASDLVRARPDGLLPKWTLNAGAWVEKPDGDS